MMLLDVMGLQYMIEQYNIVFFIVIVASIAGVIAGIVALIIHLVNRHRLKKWLNNPERKAKKQNPDHFDTI